MKMTATHRSADRRHALEQPKADLAALKASALLEELIGTDKVMALEPVKVRPDISRTGPSLITFSLKNRQFCEQGGLTVFRYISPEAVFRPHPADTLNTYFLSADPQLPELLSTLKFTPRKVKHHLLEGQKLPGKAVGRKPFRPGHEEPIFVKPTDTYHFRTIRIQAVINGLEKQLSGDHAPPRLYMPLELDREWVADVLGENQVIKLTGECYGTGIDSRREIIPGGFPPCKFLVSHSESGDRMFVSDSRGELFLANVPERFGRTPFSGEFKRDDTLCLGVPRLDDVVFAPEIETRLRLMTCRQWLVVMTEALKRSREPADFEAPMLR